jgi:hypothetical protein
MWEERGGGELSNLLNEKEMAYAGIWNLSLVGQIYLPGSEHRHVCVSPWEMVFTAQTLRFLVYKMWI